MTTPKAARKRKQEAAREKKRLQADKQRAKQAARHGSEPPSGFVTVGGAGENYADAFLESLERWMTREPPEAFTDACPVCGGEIFVTYDNDRMLHAHGEPICQPYQTLEDRMGNESPVRLSVWKAELALPVGALPWLAPAWAHGPSEELTPDEGNALLDSGQVLKSCMVSRGMPDGPDMHRQIVKTRKGLFWWPEDMGDDEDWDDEDDEDDE